MSVNVTNSVNSSHPQQYPEANDTPSYTLDWGDLENVLHRRIAYSPIFAAIGGNVQAGIFLSQAYYWTSRTNDPDGWFYKTKEDWFNETQLTRRQVDTVVHRLVNLGFISIKYAGIPRRLFYRLNKDDVTDAIARYLGSNIEVKTPETTQNQQLHKSAQQVAQFRPTSHTIPPDIAHNWNQQVAPISPNCYTVPPNKLHNLANIDSIQTQSQQPFQGTPYITQENKTKNTHISAPPSGAPEPHPVVCVPEEKNEEVDKDNLNTQKLPSLVKEKSSNLTQNPHEGKSSAAPRITKKFDTTSNEVWNCPQPELSSEFLQWKGEQMFRDGVRGVDKVNAKSRARGWCNRHQQEATDLFEAWCQNSNGGEKPVNVPDFAAMDLCQHQMFWYEYQKALKEGAAKVQEFFKKCSWMCHWVDWAKQNLVENIA